MPRRKKLDKHPQAITAQHLAEKHCAKMLIEVLNPPGLEQEAPHLHELLEALRNEAQSHATAGWMIKGENKNTPSTEQAHTNHGTDTTYTGYQRSKSRTTRSTRKTYKETLELITTISR